MSVLPIMFRVGLRIDLNGSSVFLLMMILNMMLTNSLLTTRIGLGGNMKKYIVSPERFLKFGVYVHRIYGYIEIPIIDNSFRGGSRGKGGKVKYTRK